MTRTREATGLPDEGMTHEERKQELADMLMKATQLPTSTPRQLKQRQFMLDHITRLGIIYKPFPVVLRRQSAMIHSGTIVGDKFFGDGQDGGKRHPAKRGADSEDWSNRAYIRDAETALA